jgi:hypothetical protein
MFVWAWTIAYMDVFSVHLTELKFCIRINDLRRKRRLDLFGKLKSRFASHETAFISLPDFSVRPRKICRSRSFAARSDWLF